LNKHKLAIAYLIFHLRNGNNSGNSVWGQIGFWRMAALVEVAVEGEKYGCRMDPASNGQVFRINGEEYQVGVEKVNGNLLELKINQRLETFYCLWGKNHTTIILAGFAFALRSNLLMDQVLRVDKNVNVKKVFQNLICADLFGKVLKLNIREADIVEPGQILLTLESMKTEIHVLSPSNARVKKTHVKEGIAVVERQLLVELEEISLQTQ
jgi:biotin carboxyl carrier protein